MILVWLYLLTVLIRPQEFIAGFDALPIMPLLLAASTAWWAIVRKQLSAPQFALTAMFLLITSFSVAANGWPGGGLLWFQEFAPVCLLFYLIARAAGTIRTARWFLATLVMCATVLAVHGVDQWINGVGWTGEPLNVQGRIVYLGIMNDPNDLGLFFVCSLPIAIYFLLNSGLFLKLYWLAATGLLFFGIYLTDSRGALLAAAGTVGLAVWRRFGTLAALILGGAGLAGLFALPSRLSELSVSEASAFGRVEAWYDGMQMFESSPVYGVGAGNFDALHGRTAHNTFLLVLSETGFVGFLIFLALIGYCLLMMWRLANYKSALENQEAALIKQLGQTMFYSLVGFCVAAFFLSRSYNLLFYVLCGLATGLYIGARAVDPSLPKYSLVADLPKWVGATVLAVMSLYLMVRILIITGS